jgi:hypothetical protein
MDRKMQCGGCSGTHMVRRTWEPRGHGVVCLESLHFFVSHRLVGKVEQILFLF